ncbi:DUF6538 domain-containing protein [Faunimonas sp. B44]|uniref:DUF6538 domain-containing protein n=1 Tax=Faunimonas sp. B44 TaxID=3461493 RepID=UPI004043F739
MPHPFHHPKTSVFWLRRRVQTTLVALVGKWEERYGLKTREPAEEKRRHADGLGSLERRWAELRGRPAERPASIRASQAG